MTHSYPAYYTASRLVIEGRWSPLVYYDPWFEDRVKEQTQGRVTEHFSLHPPTTALLLVPIAWLDITTARVIWQFFNLALLLAALWLVLDSLQLRDPVWRILFLAFAFVYPPMAENMRVGQSYVLMLFLFALAFWAETRKKHVGTGIGLGLAVGLKLSGLPIWLMLAVRGQWRAVLWASVVAALSALLGLVALGWEGWLGFVGRVLDYSKPVPLASHVAFQAMPSFIQRIFVGSALYNPDPLFNAPWLASVITFLVLGTAMGLTLWFGRRAPFDLAFASAVTSSVILFPMAIEYHYTLLLIPLAVMGARLFVARSPAGILCFAAILVLLCLPIDWNAPVWSEHVALLLAYPRLYGGWLLWLWLLKQMWRPSPLRVPLPLGATP